MTRIKRFIQNLLFRMADWLEPKKDEIPRKKKIEARKELQPHIDKRIEMGAIADPFGSCLSVVDNLIVSIDIMNSQFKISDDKKRKVDKIYKELNVAKRQFVILVSDMYAEEIYGKELSEEENLIVIYRIFDDLVESEYNKRKRDIYLEEWALNIKRDIDLAFKDLIEIANEENLPIRPILYNSMSPDVKIKKVIPPKNLPPNPPEDEGDEGDFGEDIPF